MICEQAQLEIGADPRASSRELDEHLRSCPACASFSAQMRALDADIRRALDSPPPTAAAAVRVQKPKAAWREWALAASVLLATLAVLGLWLLRPTDTLAHEVAEHVEKEPQSWTSTHESAESIDKALRGSGVKLDINSDKVTFAASCWFRGQYVPHFVVQTAHGPAQLIILRNMMVAGRRTFHEAGMSGVIVPAEYGSIAVLAHGGAAGVDAMAGEMQQDVHWLADAR
ncbi:MAG TPA: DUF3379 family protein [Steroidobacteraceae bacterium]|nr:DUF3379 family protein [Steroidobacteraceae bacterium]